MPLIDRFGRPLLNLRIALTRPCNLHCSYCHGEGEERSTQNPPTEMTAEEIIRIVRVAVALGISKVKLTGGEPLLRKDIIQIVRGISGIHGLDEVSMTTNGTLLAPIARELRASGLRRINISLPTIDGETYCKLTGGNLKDVLMGVEAAVDAGFNPVKLNMLVLKGVNEAQVDEMIDFAREVGAILQLIELEPINISGDYYAKHHKPLNEYEEKLKRKAIKIETRKYMQNRRVYHLSDVMVEVVHPIENTEFCMYCTRIRVTSDGKLKPCLMRNDNTVDILTHLRKGANDMELMELFKIANDRREPYNLRSIE